MKKQLFLLLAAMLMATPSHSAWLSRHPVTLVQPDGAEIHCLATGDEFHNWLHDARDFTIIQHPETGYYVYARLNGDDLVPTPHVVGKSDPAAVGLEPGVNLPAEKVRERYQTRFQVPGFKGTKSTSNIGTINNIVIFIRFSNQSEYTTGISYYENAFNGSSGVSMQNYFKEVSQNQLTINTTLYPAASTTVVSYQDANPRNYYSPYNATTNPTGYQGDTQRTQREMTLLKNATEAVKAAIQATALDFDFDDDGRVDNVTYIVQGNTDGWSDLLWPHKWALYYYNVTIGSLRVWDFNFQLSQAFGVSVLCHEMFHSLGAPDLYRYDNRDITPVGAWDLMANNQSPPQHMGAYMKWKYGQWFTTIPEISTDGTYSLAPLSSQPFAAYKIPSPKNTNQFFVVEYRRAEGTYESSVPGSGLIIYRINPSVNGNASGPPDEVYVYRPGGTLTESGTINSAHYSSTTGRTALGPSTSPSCFLSDGSDGGILISNITSAQSTISFTVTLDASPSFNAPQNLSAQITQNTSVILTWTAPEAGGPTLAGFNLYRNGNLFATINDPAATTYTDYGLNPGSYTYRATAFYTTPTGESGFSNSAVVSIVVNKPDLTITAAQLTNSVVQAGGLLQWQVAIRNQGSLASGSFENRAFLSADPLADGGDLLMGTLSVNDLAAGATQNWNASFTVPPTQNQGNWYVIFTTDHGNTVDELNETNNTEFVQVLIRRSYPDLVPVDLTVTPATVFPGGAITVTLDVENNGAQAAPESRTGFYLDRSDGRTPASLYLGNSSVPALNNGSSFGISISLNIPALAGDGAWFLIAETDTEETVQEENETNNMEAFAIEVREALPDLAVQNLMVENFLVQDGHTIDYRFSVSNLGAGAAASFPVLVYFTASPSPAGNEQPVETFTINPLNPQQSVSLTGGFEAPKGTLAGDYYIVVMADPNRTNEESSYDNNGAYRTLEVINLSDLAAEVATDRPEYRPGAPVRITMNLSNLDTGAASGYTLLAFISPTADDPSDDVVIYRDGGPAIEGSGTAAVEVTLNLGADENPGWRYILVYADSDQSLLESNEENNHAQYSFRILDVSSTGDIGLNAGFRIYPNPVSTTLFVALHEDFNPAKLLLEVVDLTGRTLWRETDSVCAHGICEIPVQTLEPGLYLLRISHGEQVVYHRFVRN